MNSDDPELYQFTIEKYEKIIEDLFEPDASLSRLKRGWFDYRYFQTLL